MKKEKKVFVMGKVYTITETNISEIEKAVQEDLDADEVMVEFIREHFK